MNINKTVLILNLMNCICKALHYSLKTLVGPHVFPGKGSKDLQKMIKDIIKMNTFDAW